MANAFTAGLNIMFDNLVVGFDDNCVLSNVVPHYTPDGQDIQRGNDVVYRPQDYHVSIVGGLDVSAAAKTDLVQRMVPATYKTPQNALWVIDAKAMRDEQHMERAGIAAGKQLAAQIDTDVGLEITNRGGIVVKKVGAMSWDDGANAEALLLTRGAKTGMSRNFVVNPFDWKSITGDLAGRQTINAVNASAYEKSRLPMLAGFETYRADITPLQTVTGTVSGTTISGAGQSLTVSAMANNLPVDNRQMTLVVAGANIANTKVGDCISLPGCNAVNLMSKDDTGQAFTTRIVGGAGTANLIVSPPVIATGPYKNATASPTNGGAVTFLNTASKPANFFFLDGSVELLVGKLAFPDEMGPKVMNTKSKNGVPIIFSYSFDHLTSVATVRANALYGVTVLEPNLCGIVIANQV
jgi:prepilin-type processing-associated H-X9-DG protein